MDSLINPVIKFHWPRWVEVCTFISHFFLALNASVNIFLYCSCDKRFFVVVQKTLRSWFVWPLTVGTRGGSAADAQLDGDFTTNGGSGGGNTVANGGGGGPNGGGFCNGTVAAAAAAAAALTANGSSGNGAIPLPAAGGVGPKARSPLCTNGKAMNGTAAAYAKRLPDTSPEEMTTVSLLAQGSSSGSPQTPQQQQQQGLRQQQLVYPVPSPVLIQDCSKIGSTSISSPVKLRRSKSLEERDSSRNEGEEDVTSARSVVGKLKPKSPSVAGNQTPKLASPDSTAKKDDTWV